MSSKSPSSSLSSPGKTIRLTLISVCLVAFVAGGLLHGCVSNKQGRKTEIAKPAQDDSSESNIARSNPGTDPQHNVAEVNRRSSALPSELKSTSVTTGTVEPKAVKDAATSNSNYNNAKSASGSLSVLQSEETSTNQNKSDSGEVKRAAAPGSAVDHEDRSRERELEESRGRRMRLPSTAHDPNRSTMQSGQPLPAVATTSGPDVVQMIGPVSQDEDLRKLPYIAPTPEEEKEPLTRYSNRIGNGVNDPFLPYKAPTSPASMPSPIQNFAGTNFSSGGSGLVPPDAQGDVGPNHYIQSVNSSIQIFSKTGTSLAGPTTFNSFFSALGISTPCGNNQNRGDGFTFYDHLAGRWVVTDFAFDSYPGSQFYECIGVSKTSDPISGGWWLYALQSDGANPTLLADYPKFALWPDAYYLSVNQFDGSQSFTGVRVYALNRSAMINGSGAPNPGAVAFTISAATLGDAYSLVPATFRTGTAPAAGLPQYFLAINSPFTANTIQNQVFVWRFHVDFNTPANSTFGVLPNHTPNGTITVSDFVDAFTGFGSMNIIPQPPGAPFLDSLGDRMMSPVVYQNLSGTESLWASHTINNGQNGTGPTAIRWYQFNVTGSSIPATPAQQHSFNNSADGLWRWMPSIAVDGQGNTSIGYSVSGSLLNPAIRYAGRLASDPPSSLSQGEAELIAGGGFQSGASRWGDYSANSIDPSDNCTFWHTNEYFSATGGAWDTRIGSFKFPSCGQSCSTITGTVSGGGTICPGGSTTVTVNVSGGTLPYTVKLTNNAETQTGTAAQTQFVFTVSATVTTIYQVDVVASHDNNNCALTNSGSATVTVTGGPPPPAILTSGLQIVTVTGSSGTFTLTFNGQTTSSLAFNAAAAQVQAALNALSSIGGAGGSVVVRQQSNVYSITFGGTLAGAIPLMTAAGSGGASVGVTRSVCAGSTGNQASAPAGASAYAWTIMNGTITSATNIQSIVYTAGASGSVTLGLTVTNASGCIATNSLGVPISASPANADVALNGPQTVTVAGSSGTFTLTFKGQTTVAMAFNATASLVQSKLSALTTIGIGGVTVTQAGNVYTVTFINGQAGPQPLMTGAGSGGASVTVTFRVCAGSAGNQARAPVSAEYVWSISNGTITSANNVQDITYTVGASGSVTLNLTVTNSTACGASSSVLVTIKPIALDKSYQSFAGNGGTGTVNVTPSDLTCGWTASTAASFIHITSGSPGTGMGAVQYSVDVNPGPNIRGDTILIGGQTFTVYQGINFLDVPSNHEFYTEIGKLSARGVTLGCGGGNYCPNDPVLREQMAAFILRAKGEFNPPPPASQRFADVPPSNQFYNFIDRLAVLQITLGCQPGNPPFYCPTVHVKREQMSAFILRGLGEFNPPPPASQMFGDVTPSNQFYNFIDRLAVLQITLGCQPGNPPLFCPNDNVTRGQMAAFLVRAFGL